jgi:RNA 3'-terminal phosphate cyclase
VHSPGADFLFFVWISFLQQPAYGHHIAVALAKRGTGIPPLPDMDWLT